MTAHPFGPTPCHPPAPSATTHAPDAARAARVDDAWQVLIDLDATDPEMADACRTLIADCRDPRRDTARDLLALLDDD